MRHFFLLFSAMLALLCSFSNPGYAATESISAVDRIVAVVNDDVILESELNQRIRSISAQLRQRGITLITKLKSNMKNRLILLSDKLLLRRRSILETITDQLKNISQIEHTRHRSLANFMVNLVGGLIAYCHQPKKPSLNLQYLMALQPA